MTARKRNRYTAQFKFDVALDATKGMKTISELAGERGVHPNQITLWKRQLLEEGPRVFGSRSVREQREQESAQAELFEQIGRLRMELEWLKKKAARYS
jgi:transposase-like protein